MSLPSGYTRLEWIESTGTQYIDTGLDVNSSTLPGLKVEADVEIIETSGVWSVSGCGNGYSVAYTGVRADGYYGYGNGTADISTGVDYVQGRRLYMLDVPNGKYKVDGVLDISVTFSTPSGSKSYLLSAYDAESGAVCHKEKIWGYKFYNNGTLVRDFVPGKNASGTVGLWDDVTETFYANAGTGTFFPGPAVEWTKLDWIESSGTQFVDAVFKPNQSTRVVAEFSTTAASTSLFGAQEGWGTKSFSFGGNTASFGANASGSLTLNDGARHSVDFKSGGIVVDGNTLFTWTGTFQLGCSMFVLANNENNANTYYSSAKLYSCKVYDNETLIRDYYPAKTVEGEVGLYDRANSEFYRNAGTGSFTAGPEVLQVPETPESFTAKKNDDAHFSLSWSAVEDADGYKVYRDGALAATQTATSYTAAVTLFQSVTFAVTAYNDDGESDPATLTVRNQPDDPTLWLITDRTQADVDALNALLAKPMSQWTAAEKAALLGGMKGGYFAADLNRVGAAVAYLAERLHGLGYAVSVSVKQDWSNSDGSTDEDMEVYRENVAALRDVLAVFSTTPDTPEDLVKLTWREANDIEQILVDVDRLITNLEQSWYYSGEVYAGEI